MIQSCILIAIATMESAAAGENVSDEIPERLRVVSSYDLDARRSFQAAASNGNRIVAISYAPAFGPSDNSELLEVVIGDNGGLSVRDISFDGCEGAASIQAAVGRLAEATDFVVIGGRELLRSNRGRVDVTAYSLDGDPLFAFELDRDGGHVRFMLVDEGDKLLALCTNFPASGALFQMTCFVECFDTANGESLWRNEFRGSIGKFRQVGNAIIGTLHENPGLRWSDCKQVKISLSGNVQTLERRLVGDATLGFLDTAQSTYEIGFLNSDGGGFRTWDVVGDSFESLSLTNGRTTLIEGYSGPYTPSQMLGVDGLQRMVTYHTWSESVEEKGYIHVVDLETGRIQRVLWSVDDWFIDVLPVSQGGDFLVVGSDALYLLAAE